MTHTLVERFRRGSKISPGRPAVQIGSDRLSYRQVEATALHWAGLLLAAGPSGAVGVLTGRSMTAYVGPLAVLYAGATVVPLPPGEPAARIHRLIEAAGIDTLICDERGVSVLPRVLASGSAVRVLDTSYFADRPPVVPESPPPELPTSIRVTPRTRAYIMFAREPAEGSEGVSLSHGTIGRQIDRFSGQHDFGPENVLAHAGDPHSWQAVHDLFAAWGAGATVRVLPSVVYSE